MVLGKGRRLTVFQWIISSSCPSSKYSYLLQDWGQSLVVSVPYAEASKVIQRIFSVSFPVSGLERTVLSTATSSNPYFDQQTSIKPAEQGQIVVTSADCKGVVIRKPSVEEAGSTQETKPINIEQTTSKGHFCNKKNGRRWSLLFCRSLPKNT